MDSILETQRQTHEELERYEQALAEVLLQNPTAPRNVTRRVRKAAEILDRIVQLRVDLVRQYEDEAGLRPQELQLLNAPAGKSGQGDDLDEFYLRLDKIKDFHKKNPGINARAFVSELDELVKGDGLQTVQVEGDDEPIVIDTMESIFSGEEAYGKHLDLYIAHSQYLNLEGSTRISYIAYLDMLRQGKVERTLDTREKALPEYMAYVQSLYDYLISFFNRALPLVNIHTKLQEEEDNFASAWEAGQISGWERTDRKAKAAVSAPAGEGIWCGYCQKHYSKQTVYDAHLSSNKHKKKEKEGTQHPDPAKDEGAAAPVASSSTSSKDKLHQPARLTFLISALLTFPPIPQVLKDSRSEVERRMALTAREREAELEEADEAPPPPAEINTGEEEEEDDDGIIYNPLKLPLGWDGKPIPFWLYKLHGLGVSFSCEICSDAAYQGRKAFDRHFQEGKHTFGMRALGLPNTKHFHGITKIAEAMALAEKLKREGREEIALAQKAEEVEDNEGNVYSRATYEALKKQGVL